MDPEAIAKALSSREWLALAIAFVAVVIAPFVQWLISSRQLRATIRSSNRQNWIDAFRQELSKYISLTGRYAHNKIYKTEGAEVVGLADSGHFERRELYERMRLRLNPKETAHMEFEKALEVLHKAINSVEQLAEAREDVVSKARGMFKYEWERVKKGK